MPDFLDDAKKLASEHSDLTDKGLDEAAKEAGERTGNKYDNQINEGEEKAEGYLGVDNKDENR